MTDDRVDILLVDDRESNLLALAAILDGFGYEIHQAGSGAEALRRILEREFAVVLLDVQMPGMDGFETAAMVRARDKSRDTPIIFLTAISQTEENVLRGYSLGAVDYVFKPIAPAILRSKVAVFVELFRRRRRELAALAELARSNNELGQFAQAAAHDLQAPLRSVTGYLDLMLRRSGNALDEKSRYYVESAAADAERMKVLIRDLLAYARLRAEPVTPETTDCDGALQQALENLRVPIEEAKAEVTRGPLPVLLADPAQMSRLFQNLVDNAVKFHGPVAPKVHVSAERRANDWLFTVRDNGMGIDAKDGERVFDLFQRLHPRREFPGTGMGLAICRRIVEQHGGRIWVESTPGRGSSFKFTFPATTPPAPTPA